MIKNRKRSLLLLSALIILIVIIYGRITSDSAMKIYISDIKIKNVRSNLDYGKYSVDEQVEKTILNNPDEYRYIFYYFNATNISKNAKIIFVLLHPIFSNEMVNNVIYYDKGGCDDPTNTILNLYPQESQIYYREILVKRNGLSDEELIKLAQGDKFRVSHSTNRWYSLFGILPNIKIAEFKK